MVLCCSCLRWLKTTTETKSKLIAWIYILTWYHLMGRKTRKPPEPITINIPVFFPLFLCLLEEAVNSLKDSWFSFHLCASSSRVWCAVRAQFVFVGWVNKLWKNVLTSVVFLAWTAVRSDCVYGMNYSTQRETQQWISIPRAHLRGSVRWMDHLCPGHVDQRWTCDWVRS